jgi:LmbE family N-acetylglucosaminyl deacetylase
VKFLSISIGLGLLALAATPARAEEAPSGAEILQELRGFREMGSVLHVAAHPDDEDTQLITYLARGRGCRAAYLSVTRGDGGQNVLGPEFDEELGAIRTQELLAARRLDHGRQFFTRAIDFGFSKDYRETLGVWDHQQVVGDIVRVIRTFRPDVVITRFSTAPGGTHGHHTASAVLALEAFKLAGDPKAFPEQLGQLTPWQPKRILQDGGGGSLSLDIGGNDPVTGEPFSAIAGHSRSMHKSQGFGNFAGGGGRGGARLDTFQLLGGEPATKDIFEGIDTTWSRVPGGGEIGKLADEAVAQFNPQDPSASLPALLKIRSLVTALPKDPVVEDKRRQLDLIIKNCLGLTFETTTPTAEVVPGETLKLRYAAVVRSSFPVRWIDSTYITADYMADMLGVPGLKPNQPATRDTEVAVPDATPVSQPYWLRKERTAGMFVVEDPSLIGRPENPPAFRIRHLFEIGDQHIDFMDEPVQVTNDPQRGEIRRRVDVIPPVTLKFPSGVTLSAPGAAHTVTVQATASRAGISGAVQLEAPSGWLIKPASQSLHLAAAGDQASFKFTVTAPSKPATAGITASALVNGARFSNQRIEIRYDHIPLILLQPAARVKMVSLDLAVRGHRVGYLPGAGDSVAEALEQMGYAVTRLSGTDLVPEKLRGLDAVVTGIRAFNVRDDLAGKMPALFAYVENGGTLIEQYNRPNGLPLDMFAPYPLRISNDRVTDENAPVTFLAPAHPALNTPNKITSADFEGWYQERGIYFPNQWDEHYTPILACSDSGEAPLKGGLLIAQSGKGYFVYTGLDWFRQLPEGVPGAYRLFANLISLGK